MSLLDHVLSVVLALVLGSTATAAPAAPPARPVGDLVLGADVSWPNCPKGLGIPARPTQGKPLPGRQARFVVIGLTNGPAFHPNPCLDLQVSDARERGLWAAAYAVVTYPTRSQLRAHAGRLRAAGTTQARQNIAAMREVGLDSPVVWVDVEPVTAPAPWSRSRRANRAVLEGALAAYRAAGLRVGLYSTPHLWREIVGDARYGLPEWRTAGLSPRRVARDRCYGPSFQGGEAVLSQWYTSEQDFDLLCPGAPAEEVLATWFTRLG